MAVIAPDRDRDRTGHDDGESFTRAVLVIACGGGALLLVVLVLAMNRWMLG